MVLLRCHIKEVLQEVHNGVSGGHLVVNKMLVKIWCRSCNAVEAQYHWLAPSMCPVCISQRTKECFERIVVNVTGPFPIARDGRKYILIVMDYFSKWPEGYSIPNQEVSTVKRALVENVFSRFWVSLELYYNQGRSFEFAVFKGVCHLLGYLDN